MLRAIRTLTGLRTVRAVAALCMTATVALGTAAAAGAAVPSGTLTSAEYRQLAAATAALNRSASSRSVNWAKARAACRRTGRATALLRTQRSSCLDSLTVLESLAGFPAQQRRCAATHTTTSTTGTGTTTTGTTTTGTTTTATTQADSAVIQLMVCMNPRYQSLARAAKVVHAADVAARKQALKRGFTGSCLATLVSTPADLRKERRFASSAQRLAADVTLLIRVTQGKAPSSDFNQTRIDSDVRLFETAATAVLGEHGQQKLSSCPHQ